MSFKNGDQFDPRFCSVSFLNAIVAKKRSSPLFLVFISMGIIIVM